MSIALLQQNLLNPPILFFFLGLLAVAMRSDLEIPQPISKFLSLYLLFAIGLKGGVELGHGGVSTDFSKLLLLAIGFSCIPGPLWLNVAFAVLVEAAIVWIVPSPLVTRLPLSLSSHRACSRSVQGLY